MRAIATLAAVFVPLTLLACDPSGSSTSSSSGTFSCDDYTLMLDVELILAQECTTDSQCGQILSGTGCGCETDDIVANSAFDTTYLYDLYDEAAAAGCSYSAPTTCACPAATGTSCDAGTCAWR